MAVPLRRGDAFRFCGGYHVWRFRNGQFYQVSTVRWVHEYPDATHFHEERAARVALAKLTPLTARIVRDYGLDTEAVV